MEKLKKMWQAWIAFGHWMGNVMSWVWMPLFYFVIVTPIALIMKLFSDPLRTKTGIQKSYWVPKEILKMDMAWAKNQGGGVPKGDEATGK